MRLGPDPVDPYTIFKIDSIMLIADRDHVNLMAELRNASRKLMDVSANTADRCGGIGLG